jgi:hypothetical protein
LLAAAAIATRKQSRENPAEVVGPEVQWLAVGAGDAGRAERPRDEFADAARGDRAVLQADDALEQQLHRRVPGALVDVVGGGQRDGSVGAAGPGDDGDRTSASSGSTTIL